MGDPHKKLIDGICLVLETAGVTGIQALDAKSKLIDIAWDYREDGVNEVYNGIRYESDARADRS